MHRRRGLPQELRTDVAGECIEGIEQYCRGIIAGPARICLADKPLHGCQLPGIVDTPAAGGILVFHFGPHVDDPGDERDAGNRVGHGAKLLDQTVQAVAASRRLLRHHLPQAGDSAPAIDFGQREKGVGEF